MDDQMIDEVENSQPQGESGVINTLRKQVKELSAKADQWEQARASLAGDLLVDAGYPGLKDIFLAKVQEFPSRDGVDQFLTGLGLARAEAQTSDEQESKAQDPPAPDLAKLTDLGSQIATAATGNKQLDLQSKLSSASSREDVEKLMAEAGLIHKGE